MRYARWFYLFLGLHLMVWTLLPFLARGNLPFDTAEGIAWGNLWALGYDKHPFLAPWLTAGITDFFGVAGWPVYLLSQLAVTLCFFAMWRLARHILREPQAMMSIMLLEAIYYYNVASTQFNPNILMLPLWALTAWMFYLACQNKRLIFWIFTGVFSGLALLAKYESALLLLSMLCFTLLDARTRAEYRRPGIYGAFFAAFLVFFPNLWWLCHHHFLPFTYTENRLDENQYAGLQTLLNHLAHPANFLFEQAGAVAPILVLFLPFFFGKRSADRSSGFHQKFLWVVGLGPFFIVLTVSLLTGAWLNALWAFPLFSFIGILLFASYQPQVTPRQTKVFFALVFGVIFLMAGARGWFLVEGSHFTHRATAALFPGEMLSQRVNEIWSEHYPSKLKYVAGKRSFIENVIAYSPQRRDMVPYFEWDLNQSPWMSNEASLRCHGAMFVWDEGSSLPAISTLPPEIAQRFPTAQVLMSLNLAPWYHAPLPKFDVGLAILPPDPKYCPPSAGLVLPNPVK